MLTGPLYAESVALQVVGACRPCCIQLNCGSRVGMQGWHTTLLVVGMEMKIIGLRRWLTADDGCDRVSAA
jgi:hypothetical protein